MLGKLFYSAKNCKNAQVSVDSVVSGHWPYCLSLSHKTLVPSSKGHRLLVQLL